MTAIHIVQRKQKARQPVIQGKRHGQPVDLLPLPTYCFKVVDTRDGDYIGDDYDTEQLAQDACDQLNARLPGHGPIE